MSESDLVRQFLQNRRSLMAYIYTVTRDREISEEIFQEVGVVVADHAARGTQVERFTGWVIGVARRQISAWYRAHEKHQRTLSISDRIADVLELAVDENQRLLDQEQEMFNHLQDCLKDLAPRSRDVIQQRYQQGKSNSTIATGLGLKLDSVKVALSRARKSLAECIERKLRHRA